MNNPLDTAADNAGPGDTAAHPLAIARAADGWSDWFWRRGGVVWLTAAACLFIAGSVTVAEFEPAGHRLTLRFRQGHGIAAGDPVRFRGIDVGRVERVAIAQDMETIELYLILNASAAGLAREGGRFWIERPQVGLSRISGLDTVVGPRYVNVQPGPASAPLSTLIVGVESPQSLIEGAPAEVLVRFREGFGLQAGDHVRYRGMTVGEITSVALDDADQHVEVKLQFQEAYRRLARQGSRFWVERPQVGFGGVRGLDTIVGGRYLAVAPGSPDAPAQTVFLGTEAAPPRLDLDPNGLEILLEGDERFGLHAGAPISFRGVEVGRVLSVELAPDAGTVVSRVFIDQPFRPLVRTNTKFWSVGGVDLTFGLRGFSVDADTLETIAAGGAAFSTPDTPGPPAPPGHRFDLASKPETKWLKWRPSLPWGEHLPAMPSVAQ